MRTALAEFQRREIGKLAMLRGELVGRRDLDALPFSQRALGEGREPAQRLDLDVEELDADRPLLGRRVDVEQPAAGRELAAVLDLVDALIAGRDESGHAVVEVEQVADAQLEGVRAQRGIGHLLAERHRGDDDDRRVAGDRMLAAGLPFKQRVERRHAQPDEVRRRRQV